MALQDGRTEDLARGTTLAAALALFDSCAPVAVDQMTGFWRGAGLRTGNPIDGLLESFGWVGKRFEDSETAHPLVFEDARGLFSLDPAGLPMSLAVRFSGALHSPVVSSVARKVMRGRRTTKPKARLRMIEYRGVVSGALVYDALPINDHFRMVHEDTLIGAMDSRFLEVPFLFTLRRSDSAVRASWAATGTSTDLTMPRSS